MSLYKRNIPKPPVGVTEFEILKASHKFLRDEEDGPEPELESQALTTTNTDNNNKDATVDTKSPTKGGNTDSWNDQLAAKYYASLYREFALCDLKHYKSGNFALRWRTEDEVVSGAGETTCGNTRCDRHLPPSSSSTSKVPLTTLELPFGYVEHGRSKSALVKVVLCGRCLKKLMWKRNKEKETQGDVDDVVLGVQDEDEGGRDDDLRDGRKEKEVRQRKPISEIEEGGSGKNKRKREECSLSEEEKHQLDRPSHSQLREGQSVERHDRGSSHASINQRERNVISDQVGQRSRSHPKSRNDHPTHKAGRQSSSFQHWHRERP